MMEIQSIATRIPNHSKAYVFGSVLTSFTPKDFDLLIVYDDAECPPDEAYLRHSPLTCEIEIVFGVRVHLTLLSVTEETSVAFIERTNATPIEAALRELTLCWSGLHSAAAHLKR